MSNIIINFLKTFSKKIDRDINRIWYEYMSTMDREANMLFMNYGWADLDPNAKQLYLDDEDEPNRFSIQLYHHVAGAVDLNGLNVLEIGSGRGGGASYIMRYLKPLSMTGIDLAVNAIRFCNRYYKIAGLCFIHGDAEALWFDDAAFDVIINIESSHCYVAMDQFLRGVYRVLKPGGYFLFADHRLQHNLAILRQQLLNTGLILLKEETITPNIIRALDLDNDRKKVLISNKVPKILHNPFYEFAGMKGTNKCYGKFKRGDSEYLYFVFRK